MRFYLAIVVQGEERVVIVFPELLPRLAVLKEVWRGAKKCLWENERTGIATKPGKEQEEKKIEDVS